MTPLPSLFVDESSRVDKYPNEVTSSSVKKNYQYTSSYVAASTARNKIYEHSWSTFCVSDVLKEGTVTRLTGGPVPVGLIAILNVHPLHRV